MGINNRVLLISRLLMVFGVLLALSSAFHFNSNWIYGEYEYGIYIVTWDGYELVL
ncbi:MAG: hypothetical protein ACFFED_09380 [Candidatus Thorarchaeota archaeon]